MKKLISICFLALFCSGCADVNPTTRTELLFDTPVTIAIYESVNDDVLTQAFSMCKSYEQRLSKTIVSSEVYKLNEAQGQSMVVSDDVIMLLKTSIDFSNLTDGLFDVTTYTLSDVWNFKALEPAVPTDEQIAAALETVNYENIVIVGNEVTLLNDAKIDLGGLGKGYTADVLKTFLIEQGVTKATISVGGNVITIGSKTSKDDWSVGIKKPFSEDNSVIMSLEVSDMSVVTSGPYERNFVIDDVLYHHILNPETGYPADSDMISVTIVAESSLIADALSTACYLVGIDRAVEIIEDLPDVEAVFIDENYEIISTSGIGDTIPVNYFE